jgi:signal transduction histidine kinase
VGAGWNDFEAARLTLAKLELSPGDRALERVLADATRISAGALSVERVGVWMFENGGAVMRCIWQHDADAARQNVPALRAVDYPVYCQALLEHRFIAADDARSHPMTRDLTSAYLEPLGIVSMLDAPVYRGSELIGIVCHEHTGEVRQWTGAEQDLAGTVADVIALVFEQARRITLEQQLAETQAKLRELSLLDDVARIVAATSHDLNNLLTLITTSAALLETQATDAAAVRSSAADLREVAARAAVLVRRLLGLRRASEPVPSRIELTALVRRLAPVLRALLGAEHRLVVHEPRGGEVAVTGEPLSIEQALVNLVTNARHASDPEGVVEVAVDTTERVIDGRRRPFAVLQVSDHGAGMTDDVRRSAHEPFFTTRGDDGGTGLGLHIVETVARRSGGFVEIDSALGRGTTVRIFLPRAD